MSIIHGATIGVITSDNEMITGAFFAGIIRINCEIKATSNNSNKMTKAELFKSRWVGIMASVFGESDLALN